MEIQISEESIRLGQLLKLAAVIGAGAEAKALLADGIVTVNGEVETRRGRQVRPGDVVGVDPANGGPVIAVVAASE